MNANDSAAFQPGSKFPCLERRAFLRYLGAGSVTPWMGFALGALPAAARAPETPSPFLIDGWRGVPYPLPLPGQAPNVRPPVHYEVQDDLVLPEGYRYDVLVESGAPVRAGERRFMVGTGCDYLGLVPRRDHEGQYWLLINHEYISGRPWLQDQPRTHPQLPPLEFAGQDKAHPQIRLDGQVHHGWRLDVQHPDPKTPPEVLSRMRSYAHAMMDDLGVSVLLVEPSPAGGWRLVADQEPARRCSGCGSSGFPESGPRYTGPVTRLASLVQQGPPRTFGNCSGGTTPWGTILSCEENVQDMITFEITPDGRMIVDPVDQVARLMPMEAHGVGHPSGLPFEFSGLMSGAGDELDGRYFGWVCEIDPERGTLVKHSALGRFRHENVTVRVQAGSALAAYMGDDRRGGHVYKYVSHDLVQDPSATSNSRLFEHGVLYVARFHPDFTGSWISLLPDTPVVYPQPHVCADGFLWLPDRPGGGGVKVGAEALPEQGIISVAQWVERIAAFTGKSLRATTLGDLVIADTPADRLGIILMDSFLMANAAGATPTARPEDLEVHPVDRSVYIAFTDSTGSGDGSPDRMIFPDSAGRNSRQYGAVFRLAEGDDDPAATRFTWGRFVHAGETAEGGGGFACADNLAFDAQGNLWMVTDISTTVHNFATSRRSPETQPGGKRFPGVFGNNALFMIPTSGPQAGIPRCFGIAPMESELTGITFSPDGRSLLLSVQHPGELNGTRGLDERGDPESLLREFWIADAEGNLHRQARRIPVGSNFPSGKPGVTPRSCVVVIRPDL